jgi:hypothetical protein
MSASAWVRRSAGDPEKSLESTNSSAFQRLAVQCELTIDTATPVEELCELAVTFERIAST